MDQGRTARTWARANSGAGNGLRQPRTGGPESSVALSIHSFPHPGRYRLGPVGIQPVKQNVLHGSPCCPRVTVWERTESWLGWHRLIIRNRLGNSRLVVLCGSDSRRMPRWWWRRGGPHLSGKWIQKVSIEAITAVWRVMSIGQRLLIEWPTLQDYLMSARCGLCPRRMPQGPGRSRVQNSASGSNLSWRGPSF